MPLYEFSCPMGHKREEFRKVANRDSRLECDCGKPMIRLPSVTHFKMKNGPMSPKAAVKKHMGLKDGDRCYVNPTTQERVHLTGSKAHQRRQVYESHLKHKPNLKLKDVELMN